MEAEYSSKMEMLQSILNEHEEMEKFIEVKTEELDQLR